MQLTNNTGIFGRKTVGRYKASDNSMGLTRTARDRSKIGADNGAETTEN